MFFYFVTYIFVIFYFQWSKINALFSLFGQPIIFNYNFSAHSVSIIIKNVVKCFLIKRMALPTMDSISFKHGRYHSNFIECKRDLFFPFQFIPCSYLTKMSYAYGDELILGDTHNKIISLILSEL